MLQIDEETENVLDLFYITFKNLNNFTSVKRLIPLFTTVHFSNALTEFVKALLCFVWFVVGFYLRKEA